MPDSRPLARIAETVARRDRATVPRQAREPSILGAIVGLHVGFLENNIGLLELKQ
jgi:hypothetical protein